MFSKSNFLIVLAVFLTIINVVSCYRATKILVSADTEYTKLLAVLEADAQELISLGKKYDSDKVDLFDRLLEELVRKSKDGTPAIEQLQKENILIIDQLKRSERVIDFYKKRFNELLVKIKTYSL